MTSTETHAIRERIATLTAEFGVPEPELSYEDGEVLLTDDLLDWCIAHEMPIDWTLFGDARLMLRAYRSRQTEQRPMVDAIKKLTEEEQRVLFAGLHAHAAGVPMEDAMAAVKQVVEERRAEAET